MAPHRGPEPATSVPGDCAGTAVHVGDPLVTESDEVVHRESGAEDVVVADRPQVRDARLVAADGHRRAAGIDGVLRPVG